MFFPRLSLIRGLHPGLCHLSRREMAHFVAAFLATPAGLLPPSGTRSTER